MEGCLAQLEAQFDATTLATSRRPGTEDISRSSHSQPMAITRGQSKAHVSRPPMRARVVGVASSSRCQRGWSLVGRQPYEDLGD